MIRFFILIFIIIFFCIEKVFSQNKDVNVLKLDKINIYCNKTDFNLIYRKPYENNYISVDLIYNETKLDKVKMRIRGDSSRRFSKKSLKLKLNQNNLFPDGVTDINLNGLQLDKSFIREAIATFVITKSGYPCFLAQPVIVSLNDTCIGLYMNVGAVDDYFLESNGLDKRNNLYKADKDSACLSIYDNLESMWQKKTNKDINGFNDLQELILLLDTVSEEEYPEFAKAIFDYDKMVHIIALNLLLGNHSTYYHNYFMYHDLTKNKWLMLPWDLDNTLFLEDCKKNYQTGNYSDEVNSEMASNLFFERALATPIILKDIKKKVFEIRNTVFNNEFLNPVIDKYVKQLTPYIKMDAAFNTVSFSEWENAINNIKEFIDKRYKNLMYQFDHSPSSFRLHKPNYHNKFPILSWSNSKDPDNKSLSYILKYSSTSDFVSDKTTTVKISDNSFTIKDVLKKGIYYWKVFADDGEFLIPGFDNRSFFIIE